MSNEARDYDSVNCPNCRHQFRALSDSDKEEIDQLEAQVAALTEQVETAREALGNLDFNAAYAALIQEKAVNLPPMFDPNGGVSDE